MRRMSEGNSSTKWILAITGATITGFIYLICCICSIHKAIKDRKQIIERNCAKRNKRYLKEMGIESDKKMLQTGKARFAISKHEQSIEPIKDDTPTNHNHHISEFSIHPPTNAKRINLENIEEILNESISVNASTNSSLVGKPISENSQSRNSMNNNEMRSNQTIVTSLRKPVIVESIPKFYYLKAHNPHVKGTPSNWVAERLNNASSFADAQRQLQFGSKRAPLAKQNSGFSSMDEDSSASVNV